MTTKFFGWLTPAILLAVLFTCNLARAQSYRVAHTSDGFTSFQYALINNLGVVVFYGIRRDSSGNAFEGVYKGRGGAFSVVAEALIVNRPSNALVPAGGALMDINDAGAVALDGYVSGFLSVYLSRGGVGPSDIVDRTRGDGLLPTITDQGFLAYGPSIRGPFPDLRSDNPTVSPCDSCAGYGRLNNRNQYLLISGPQIFRVSVDAVQTSPRTSKLEPIQSNLVATVSAGFPLGAMLNDSGTVVYGDTKPGVIRGIYRDAGTPVVEQFSGSEFFFNGAADFTINKGGTVAFLAFSRTLGKLGFFRGTSPLVDKIVAEGDTVAGSQVFQLSAPGGVDRWINDSGQIVFQATDQNGGTGLYVTGGVPSPPLQNPTPTSRFEWNPASSPSPTPPNGSFGIMDNWKPLDGTTNRVPEKTSNHADIAIFDRAEAYTVELGTRHNDRLIVRFGDVIFVSGTHLVDHLAPDFPAVLIDKARLSLLTGMLLTNNHALIGETTGTQSTVSVGFGGKWNSSSLTVGGNGHGILEVNAAGTVISAESLIGDGPGGGKVTVKDSGSWKTGNLAIGAVGKGSLTIQDGGNVQSDRAFIGHAPGTDHVVTVQGAGADRSMWNLSELTVAERGDGRLEVKDGASVIVGLSARIADAPGVTGSVTVSGVGTNSLSSTLFSVGLDVGAHGDGSLIIEDGGNVEVDLNAVSIGTAGGGTGNILIRGIHPISGRHSTLMLASLPEQGQTLTIARGKMRIEAGGVVKSRTAAISTGTATTPNEVVISDPASSWTIEGQLFVGGELIDINGQNGQAILTLAGAVVQASRILLGTGGTIHGNGTIYVPDPSNPVENNGGTLDLSGVQVDIPLTPIGPANVPSDTGAFRSPRTRGLLGPEPRAQATNVLTILGSYKQSPNGRLLIEIGGTNSADYHHLIITNVATLDGNVTLKFINGFAPKVGDHFDFLSVGGELSGAFATVGLQNLASGFQFNFATNGPLLSMTALNDGLFDPRLPGQVDVTLTNVGGLTYATYVITTSNTCQRITLDGALTQTNNVFSQAFQGTTFIGGECIDQTDTITNTLLMGALPPGDYSFRILANTQAVQTVAFTVPSNAGKTLLAPTRLPDGSVRFQIGGLSPIRYTIEASQDLRNWIELGSGTLPDAFTDPDAAIFRTRFYRARIGP